MVFQGRKDIFQNLLRGASIKIFIGLLCWTKKVSFYFIKTYFQPVFTSKEFKHCMFEQRLQIEFYDQNLVRKKRTLKSNLVYSDKIHLQNYGNSSLL